MTSISSFDPTRYYLGTLCKRNHDWNNTGKSLRQLGRDHCVECVRIVEKNRQAHGISVRRSAKLTTLTDRIKLERGCADCGYKAHPAALHFDHIEGSDKLLNVSQMSSRSEAVILNEISKCEVVCANCHAIRTANRSKPWEERVEQKRISQMIDVGNNTKKLTEDQVGEIRRKYVRGIITYKMLAGEYGVTVMAIAAIIQGRSWKHIP